MFKIKNKIFVTSMTTIISLFGLLIFFLLIVFNLAEISLNYLLIISIIVLVLQFFLSPILMDLVMKCLYKARFDAEIPDYLNNYIIEICKKNNMKYPKIGYIIDGAPNAFTYGRTKNDARIILTKGIFELLSEEEVKTVVSHEIGHAVHYDMFLMTAVQIIPLILYYVFETTFNPRKKDNKANKTALIGIIAYIFYIISEYIILWFSRTREYYADQFAIEATKNPNAFANALVKIGYGLTTRKEENKVNISSVKALGIFDSNASKSFVVSSYDNGKLSKDNIKKAARWELWNPWATWYEINSTHPMISKRIKAICKYCSLYNQPIYVTFDEKKPESYVDDFVIEFFIKFLPFITLIVLVMIGIFGYDSITNFLLFIGISIVIFGISLLFPFSKSHKNKNYKHMQVCDLLGEVKVSGITSIPCIIKGQIIGKGNPGYILSEDFVIQDETGIIFLDYNQPLALINIFFALLKSNEYINKYVEIKGWYRRSPVPYIEIYTITVDGKIKKCYAYAFTKALIYIIIIIGLILSIISL